MGTIDYMAPEQFGNSHDIDIRADIYSLGACLYKLLCGFPPYGGLGYDKLPEKIAALSLKPVPPIRSRRPDVPAQLASIVQRMLARQPGSRFANPREVATALGPFATEASLPDWLPAHSAATARSRPWIRPTSRPIRTLPRHTEIRKSNWMPRRHGAPQRPDTSRLMPRPWGARRNACTCGRRGVLLRCRRAIRVCSRCLSLHLRHSREGINGTCTLPTR